MWKFVPDFSWTMAYFPFALVDFNLYASTIINWNLSVTAFLSCVSLSRESSTESGLGTPDTSSHWVSFYRSTYNELSLSVSFCAVIYLRARTLYDLPTISSA